LDGYKKQWLGVALVNGCFHSAAVFGSIREALAAEPKVSIVAIDIPIGLGDGHGRPADHEAKRYVGERASSVFLTFPQAVYDAADYAAANRVARRLTDMGISQQSYRLREKISEASAAAAEDSRLVEVHPEVSFRELAGAPVAFSKKSWHGILERRRLLRGAGIIVCDDLPADVGRATPDDILDAAVAAWTARRIANGTAKVLPASKPARRGQLGVIWY
jgi:predicted RNase H-like nuclease